MKVLILTQEKYAEFIGKTIFPYNAEHDVHAFHGKPPYPFETWLGMYDIGISFMYQHKVPAKEVNSHTWFNFHPAPLPEYKGRNLCYHAIMNQELTFGATVHYMDENFDTGDIIDVWKFFIADWWSAQDLSEQAIIKSKSMFKEYFPQIIRGKQFERLPNVGGMYYRQMPIGDSFHITEDQAKRIRAITYGDFYPKVGIGGVTYKIVRDE